MPANVEVKVAAGDFATLRRRLRDLGARRVRAWRQRDTYFDVQGLRLKLREENGASSLIPYRRPNRAGDRRSDYVVLPVIDARFARRLFRVRVVVDKVRELWRVERTRVHLDRVRGLGTFVELETEAHPRAQAECRRVLARLGLADEPAIAGSYSDLLTKQAGNRQSAKPPS